MGSNAKNFTVEQLVKLGILEKPIDGNHGGIQALFHLRVGEYFHAAK